MDLRDDRVVALVADGTPGTTLLAGACTDVRDWRERRGASGPPASDPLASGPGAPGLMIDLGDDAFADAGVVRRVAAIVAALEIDPASVCLTVRLDGVLVDVDAAVTRCAELHAVGVRLAIEGFGSAGGTFALLRRLPVDVLVAGPPLVARVEHDRYALSLALALLSLAKISGLVSVARGVESDGALRRFRALGFDRAQGPQVTAMLGAPTPADLLDAAAGRTVLRP